MGVGVNVFTFGWRRALHAHNDPLAKIGRIKVGLSIIDQPDPVNGNTTFKRRPEISR